jgi:hypothetical protein
MSNKDVRVSTVSSILTHTWRIDPCSAPGVSTSLLSSAADVGLHGVVEIGVGGLGVGSSTVGADPSEGKSGQR